MDGDEHEITPEEMERQLLDLKLWFEKEAERDHPEGWTLILVTVNGFHASYHTAASIAPYIVQVPHRRRIVYQAPDGPIVDPGIQHLTFKQKQIDEKRSVAWYEEE